MWRQGPLLSVPTGEWAEDLTFCSKTVSATMDKIFEKSAKMSSIILYTSLSKWMTSVSSQYDSWAKDRSVSVLAECCWGWLILINSFSICFDTELTWLVPSCHQNLLGDYPPNHVLSTLEYLASREQKELEEKLISLDVTQDVTALR